MQLALEGLQEHHVQVAGSQHKVENSDMFRLNVCRLLLLLHDVYFQAENKSRRPFLLRPLAVSEA